MVPQLVSEPGKWVANAYFCRPGGMSANAALVAQRVRAAPSPQVLLCAPFGDDEPGAALQGALQDAGVTLHPACRVAGARTSVSAVLIDAQGERQGHNVRGNAQHTCPLPDAHWLTGVRAVQVDPRWPEGARAALLAARERGLISMLDADVAPSDVLRGLAPMADWVVFSSDGLRAWAGLAKDTRNIDEAFKQACEALPAAQVVVTQGASGLRWREPGQPVVAMPAHAVRVVNTNGAGDALHGALLLALAEGQPPAQALHFGVAAAACSVTAAPYGRAEVMALVS